MLWRKAPFVLGRHRSALAAIVAGGLLVALAASSAPLVTTASASEALHNQLVGLSPLATGLVVEGQLGGNGDLHGARAASLRDRAARALASRLRLQQPVFTEESPPFFVTTGNGTTQVALMARSGVLRHVARLGQVRGAGVWISDLTAANLRLRPGSRFRIGYQQQGLAARTVSLRVKGIYRALDRSGSAPGPYWANFLPEILPPGVDPPPPVRYVFLTPSQLYRAIGSLSQVGTFTYQGRTYHGTSGPTLRSVTEMAVDPNGTTLPGARRLAARFAALPATLRRSQLGGDLGCRPPAGVRSAAASEPLACSLSSSLSSAVALADRNAGEISPVVNLLSGAGTGIALALVAAAGLFLVRRRAAEAALLFARGEHPLSFAARTGLEGLLPTLAGCAAGIGLALAVTSLVAPAGAIDGKTVRAAVLHGGVAAGVGLLLLVALATALFMRQFDTRRHTALARLTRWVPWELPLLAVAGWLLDDVVSGGGLAGSGSDQGRHLTLPVFVLPLLLVAGAAGLATRIARLALRSRPGGPDRLTTAGFLAVRRLAAAQGLLVAIAVVSAVSLGAFFYAQSLAASLDRSVTEKAYLGYGGDAQGLVDATAAVPKTFPYPATKIDFGNGAASLGGPAGTPADVLAIDPASFGRVVRWYADWGPDPRRSLSRLAAGADGRLPVIVAGTAPAHMTAVWIGGVRVPVRIVSRVSAFPGISAGTPMVVVGNRALGQAAAHVHLLDQLEQPQSFVWAKGPPAAVARALAMDPLRASYVTTAESFTADPNVKLAQRMFRYMRVIALAAAVLVLASLLLYLQARQRTQTVGLALAERMGLRGRTYVWSLVLELSAITGLAAAVGGTVALGAGAPIVGHIDPLPDNPPAPTLAVPYPSIAAGVAAVLVFVGAAAVLARWSSRRADIVEALRVD